VSSSEGNAVRSAALFVRQAVGEEVGEAVPALNVVHRLGDRSMGTRGRPARGRIQALKSATNGGDVLLTHRQVSASVEDGIYVEDGLAGERRDRWRLAAAVGGAGDDDVEESQCDGIEALRSPYPS
jgi:hypothetical protein